MTALDMLHPAVALLYFAVMLGMCMAAMQPVYLGLSFAAAFAHGIALRGARATMRSLCWQLALAAVVALANLALSATGSTELLRIGARAFYAESLAYGACMGLMLATVLATFSNASHVLTSDKVMALFGGVAPTIGLMISMTMRLVPRLVRQGSGIADVQRACSSARMPAGRRGVRGNLRLSSVLMGWAMEDSLEAADAMKARGWGSTPRRTVYARFRIRRFDAAALAALGALALASAAAAWTACAQFSFYPRIEGLAAWWSYAPFALFALFPLVVEVRERALWRL